MKRSSSNASRVWLMSLGLAFLVALVVMLRTLGGGDLASEAASRAPDLGPTAILDARPALAASASGQRDDVPTAAVDTPAPTSKSAEPTPPVADPLVDVWALVAQLEALASTRSTYHDQALAVIERLTEACRTVEATDSASAPKSDVWSTLLEQVVRAGERSELVRGAVALAIARGLPEADFWRLFDEWLLLPREGSLELVRAAALAAALRGDDAPCHRGLALGRLAALPGAEDERPGIYPLVLDRLARPAASAALKAWIDLPDRRRRLFRVAAPIVEDALERAAAVDYFVAAEVLYCVWGHGALADSATERNLVSTALLEGVDAKDADLLTLRAAHFLLRSLVECSARIADGAKRARASSTPLVAGIARSMEGLGVGGLSLELMAELERLRYSRSSADEGELMMNLMDAGAALVELSRSAPADRLQAIEYLKAFASDSNVTEFGRNSALMALVDNVSWSELLLIARETLERGDSGVQAATAIDALLTGVGGDSGRRSQAIALLSDVSARSRIAVVLELVSEALRTLRT